MYHAAFVLPAVFACYKTDGNLKKDNAYLHRLIDANIEGYRAIRNAGHKILPDADKEFEGAAWTRKSYSRLGITFSHASLLLVAFAANH